MLDIKMDPKGQENAKKRVNPKDVPSHLQVCEYPPGGIRHLGSGCFILAGVGELWLVT